MDPEKDVLLLLCLAGEEPEQSLGQMVGGKRTWHLLYSSNGSLHFWVTDHFTKVMKPMDSVPRNTHTHTLAHVISGVSQIPWCPGIKLQLSPSLLGKIYNLC